MRERTTWNKEVISNQSSKFADDPRAMNQDHFSKQPAADAYSKGGPSEFAEDVHPPDWKAEQDKRDAVGFPAPTPSSKQATVTNEEITLKKADLCTKIARKMLSAEAPEQMVEDQALALMNLPDSDLIETSNRLLGIHVAEQKADDEEEEDQEKQSYKKCPSQSLSINECQAAYHGVGGGAEGMKAAIKVALNTIIVAKETSSGRQEVAASKFRDDVVAGCRAARIKSGGGMVGMKAALDAAFNSMKIMEPKEAGVYAGKGRKMSDTDLEKCQARYHGAGGGAAGMKAAIESALNAMKIGDGTSGQQDQEQQQLAQEQQQLAQEQEQQQQAQQQEQQQQAQQQEQQQQAQQQEQQQQAQQQEQQQLAQQQEQDSGQTQSFGPPETAKPGVATNQDRGPEPQDGQQLATGEDKPVGWRSFAFTQEQQQQQQAFDGSDVGNQAMKLSEEQMLNQMLQSTDGQQVTALDQMPNMATEADIEMQPSMDIGETGLTQEDAVLQQLFASDPEVQMAAQAQQIQTGVNPLASTPVETSTRTASVQPRVVGARSSGGVSVLGGGASKGNGSSEVSKLSGLWRSAPDVSTVFNQ